MKRREFIKKSAIYGVGASLYPYGKLLAGKRNHKLKILVLGIDGMDPHLASVYMHKGLLPNFTRLANTGSFSRCATTFPPQSPVAWSTFTVGAPPQLHGIYDFIHRKPASMLPYLSTSKVNPASKTLDIGDWKIPLIGGNTENLRKGIPFWDYLAAEDIPTSVFKMPGNFPSDSENVRMVSGMGTPDLRGGYGSFTLYTTSPPANADKFTGGMVVPLTFNDDFVETSLEGPVNTMRQDTPKTRIPIQIWRDRINSVVKLNIDGHELILNNGEWTDWIPLTFPMMSFLSEVKGICKIYIKNVHPEFVMYVSPVNIDPSDPVLPVVSSEEYGKELVENVGYFYTQGLPEDTKALSYGVLNDAEYLDLAYQIINERSALLDYELNRFSKLDTGFQFFYFSSLDQDTHMFWRAMDSGHPLHDEKLKQEFGTTLQHLYVKMDQILGNVLERFDINDPNFRLVVMSDHGFAPFRRQVNVNTWLFEKGYLDLPNRNSMESSGYFSNVNWDKTAAYSLGINSLYLNLEGRERFGAVSPSQSKELLKKIGKDLLSLQDPKTGQQAVTNIWTPNEHDKRQHAHVPDMIIGWNRGFRNSWDSILGGLSNEVFMDNDDKWSGDHCIDPALVPGVLFCNRKVTKQQPALADITATILADFGIPIPVQMTGKPLYHV